MDTTQRNLIRQLSEEGHSYREIARQTGLSKSTVERELKGLPVGEVDTSVLTEVAAATGGQCSQKASTDRELEMKRLEVSREALHVRKSELSLREKEASERQERIEAQKNLFLSQYRRLMKEFFDNCQDSQWDNDDIEDYLHRLEALSERIEIFCKKEIIDHEGLSIWSNVQEIIEDVSEEKDEQTGGFFNAKSQVDFNLTDEEAEALEERYELTDFDDEAPEDVEDDEADDDEGEGEEEDEEEDDNEDDEDDEKLAGLAGTRWSRYV